MYFVSWGFWDRESEDLPEEDEVVRDPKRIDRILGLVEKIWKENPDWRLGQLIRNMSGELRIFGIEDDILEDNLNKWINRE